MSVFPLLHIYEGGLKSSWADYDAMVEFVQMWFIFQHSLPCAAVHIVLPLVWQRLDSRGIEALILILEKKSSTADMTSSSVRYCFPAKCFIRVGEQKIVRWCQIRRVWRVINQFKDTVTHSSHYNHKLVCRSIVLVKQDSLRQIYPYSRNVSIVLLFKVLNYLCSVGLSGTIQFFFFFFFFFFLGGLACLSERLVMYKDTPTPCLRRKLIIDSTSFLWQKKTSVGNHGLHPIIVKHHPWINPAYATGCGTTPS